MPLWWERQPQVSHQLSLENSPIHTAKKMLQKLGTVLILHCVSEDKFIGKQDSLVLLLVKLIASSSYLLMGAFREIRIWKCCITFSYYYFFLTNAVKIMQFNQY